MGVNSCTGQYTIFLQKFCSEYYASVQLNALQNLLRDSISTYGTFYYSMCYYGMHYTYN